MKIPWQHDLRPTWRVRLTYRAEVRLNLGGRVAHRLESELLDSGRVRAPRVTLTRGSATVACIVKGVDDTEAAYVALAYVGTAAGQVDALTLGELTYSSAMHLPPTMGDGDG